MTTLIKICGVTNHNDASKIASLNVNAIGFIFYKKSPRYVDPVIAEKIISNLPPFISTVALFVNPSEKNVKDTIQTIKPDIIQFHGNESPVFCESFSRPYIKAVRMKSDVNLELIAEKYNNCKGLVLDSYNEDIFGGSGKKFDWDKVPRSIGKPIILAGGLNPTNVKYAIKSVRPWAVDVCSGIELENGIKDLKKLEAFVKGVKDADV